MGEFKYRAFISYSWADAKWGKWLHHQLETYRTPPALVGKEGAHGPVGRRLHPIFKDREEEAAGASIGEAVEKALGNSEFLIVICSPQSAKSKWVDHEIAWFKTHRDPAKVLALIVDGEPGGTGNECFPKALTHNISSDLTVIGEELDAPLAADARITGDGKRRAKLKIAAAMLGVGLDELVNRDERRRTIRTRIVVAASLALAAVMSGMAWFAIEQRNEAREQRAEAEGQIEFMLTDLRERLEPVGRLDVLEAVGERALDYYARQKLSDLDADGLGRRARALLLVGEVSNLRGDSEEALRAFTEAAATTQEQLDRDPDNTQRIYDHAQSVFWVGYIAYTRGELDNAEAQFREYQRLANRLVQLEPENPDWQLEGSYAETNMGVMLREQGRHEEAEPFFARGLERIEAVAASEEWDASRQVDVGISLNWLAMTKDSLGNYAEALQLFRREVASYESILVREPNNSTAKDRLAVSHQLVGEQFLNAGDLADAITAYENSLAVNADLLALEPENTAWRETELRGLFGMFDVMLYSGRRQQAQDFHDRSRARLAALIATDPTNTHWSEELTLIMMRNSVEMRLELRNITAAENVLQEAELLARATGGSWPSIFHLLDGETQAAKGMQSTAREAWQRSLEALPSGASYDGYRLFLLRRLGVVDEARRIARELDTRGYRHPFYLAASEAIPST